MEALVESPEFLIDDFSSLWNGNNNDTEQDDNEGEENQVSILGAMLPASSSHGPVVITTVGAESVAPKERTNSEDSSIEKQVSAVRQKTSGIEVNSFQDLQPPSRAPYAPYCTVTPQSQSACLRVRDLAPISRSSTLRSITDQALFTSESSLVIQQNGGNGRRRRREDPFTKSTSEAKVMTINNTDKEVGAFVGTVDVVTGLPLRGRLISKQKGQVYDGPFTCGRRHGDDATFEDLAAEIKFFGSFMNDVPHMGSLLTPAYTYRGLLDDNMQFHGNGSLATKDGILYEGEFTHGRYDGVGREVLPDGTTYKGQYVSGNRHGIGTLFVPKRRWTKLPSAGASSDKDESRAENDSARHTEEEETKNNDGVEEENAMMRYSYSYSGVWWHGNMEGEGTEVVQAQDEVYTGQFFRSKRHGFGILKFPEFSVEGTWRAGSPVDGNGWNITFANGNKYHGCVADYKPHGVGMMVYSGEAPTHTESSSGKDKNVVEIEAEEDIYYGQFKEGKRDGEGLCVKKDGGEFRGIWYEDRLMKIVEELEPQEGLASCRLFSGVPSLVSMEAANLSANDGPPQTILALDQEIKSLSESSGMHDSSLDTLSVLKKVLPEGFFPPSLGGEEQNDASSVNSQDLPSQENKDSTIHRYPNNDAFVGQVDTDGLRQGHGRYTEQRSGATYEGDWKDNKRHGRGVLVTSHVKYCGEYKEDKREGQGTLIWNDSSCYTGQFSDDVFHGVGTICEADGVTYSGTWKDGQRHGEGLETFADGTVYLGEYHNGKRDGVGTLLEKKGGAVMYSGQWEDGLMHGEGVRVFKASNNNDDEEDDVVRTNVDADSSDQQQRRRRQYEGFFARGKMSGLGRLTTEDGMVFDGKWDDNVPLGGSWKITMKDGSQFAGMAKTCETTKLVTPHGHGTMKYANGDNYTGHFVNGKRGGKGVCVFANGDRYDGEWNNDIVSITGSGELRLADGTIHTFGGHRGQRPRTSRTAPAQRSQ